MSTSKNIRTYPGEYWALARRLAQEKVIVIEPVSYSFAVGFRTKFNTWRRLVLDTEEREAFSLEEQAALQASEFRIKGENGKQGPQRITIIHTDFTDESRIIRKALGEGDIYPGLSGAPTVEENPLEENPILALDTAVEDYLLGKKSPK